MESAVSRSPRGDRHDDQHNDAILHDHNDDGVDRRGFLKCMAWAGTGRVFLMEGGVLKSYGLGRLPARDPSRRGELSFVQISDSHMGFNKAANPDVVGTLKTAIDKINALPAPPDVHAAHRRHQPPVEARGVRHRASRS